MRREPRQFLVDIDAVGEQHDFLAYALVVARRHRLAQARRQFLLECGDYLRHARRDGCDPRLHRRDALEQQVFQFLAFARARCGKILEHRLQRVVARGAHGIERHGLRAQHAGPAQDVRGSEAGYAGPCGAQLFAQGAQLLQHLVVEFERLRRVRQRIEADAALDLAALQAGDDQLPQARLERAQFLGQAELQIEIAVVDRAQFDVECRRGEFARCAGESGHAVDHEKTSDW